MTDRHTVVPRVLCFILSGDDILLIKSSRKKDWHGFYQPPGGHIDKGEGVIEAAEREILEETGLKMKSTKLAGIVHESGFFGKEVMLFVTKSIVTKGVLAGSDEGQPVWINLKEIDKIKLLEDTKPMLKKVLELNNGEIFVGTSEFDGKDKLLSFQIKVQ